MPKRTHDWNNLQNYLNVHEKVLKQYSTLFANQPRYSHEWATEQWLILRVTFHFLVGGIKLEVTKHAEVRSTGRLKSAKTFEYHYSVFDDRGSLFRYCSPHEHRPYHHKHVYDPVSRKQAKDSPCPVAEDHVPHLSDVVDEVMAYIHSVSDERE